MGANTRGSLSRLASTHTHTTTRKDGRVAGLPLYIQANIHILRADARSARIYSIYRGTRLHGCSGGASQQRGSGGRTTGVTYTYIYIHAHAHNDAVHYRPAAYIYIYPHTRSSSAMCVGVCVCVSLPRTRATLQTRSIVNYRPNLYSRLPETARKSLSVRSLALSLLASTHTFSQPRVYPHIYA